MIIGFFVLFLFLLIFFLVMRFTLTSHFRRISLPEHTSYINENILKVFQIGGIIILFFLLLFLLLIFV